jgi:hypothetical protein
MKSTLFCSSLFSARENFGKFDDNISRISLGYSPKNNGSKNLRKEEES